MHALFTLILLSGSPEYGAFAQESPVSYDPFASSVKKSDCHCPHNCDCPGTRGGPCECGAQRHEAPCSLGCCCGCNEGAPCKCGKAEQSQDTQDTQETVSDTAPEKRRPVRRTVPGPGYYDAPYYQPPYRPTYQPSYWQYMPQYGRQYRPAAAQSYRPQIQTVRATRGC